VNLRTKQLETTDIERLKTWLKKLIGDEFDKIDFHSHVDRTLNYTENQDIFRKLIKSNMSNMEEQVEEYKAEQERLENERRRAAELEVEEYNSKIVFDDQVEVEEYYENINHGIMKMTQGYSNLLFVKGRAGLGKSRNIRKALTQHKADYIELTGEVTEAYLYRLIFENNGKIIWLRDVVKLISNTSTINLLKAAAESEENRVLTKSSYSKEQKNLPDRFVCKCKFIFDYNNIIGSATQMQSDFEALVSRGDYIELSFCDKEITHMMKLIAKNGNEKTVTEYLIKNYEETGLVRLNLRTQWRAFKTYEFAIKNDLNWKKELDREFKQTNRIRSLLYGLIGDKAVRVAELKKKMLKLNIVNTLRTADNRINEYLYIDELFKVSEDVKNFYVCINDTRKKLGEAI